MPMAVCCLKGPLFLLPMPQRTASPPERFRPGTRQASPTLRSLRRFVSFGKPRPRSGDPPGLELRAHSLPVTAVPVVPVAGRAPPEPRGMAMEDVVRDPIPGGRGVGLLQESVAHGTPPECAFRVRPNPSLLRQLAELLTHMVGADEHDAWKALQLLTSREESPIPVRGLNGERFPRAGAAILRVISQDAEPLGQPPQHAVCEKAFFHGPTGHLTLAPRGGSS